MSVIPPLRAGEYLGASKAPEVRLAPRGTNLFAGSLTASTTPQAIGSQPCKEVMVQADPLNTTNVRVGPSASQAITLQPGQAAIVDVIDVSLIYATAVSGSPVVNWWATV